MSRITAKHAMKNLEPRTGILHDHVGVKYILYVPNTIHSTYKCWRHIYAGVSGTPSFEYSKRHASLGADLI